MRHVIGAEAAPTTLRSGVLRDAATRLVGFIRDRAPRCVTLIATEGAPTTLALARAFRADSYGNFQKRGARHAPLWCRRNPAPVARKAKVRSRVGSEYWPRTADSGSTEVLRPTSGRLTRRPRVISDQFRRRHLHVEGSLGSGAPWQAPRRKCQRRTKLASISTSMPGATRSATPTVERAGRFMRPASSPKYRR